MEYTEEFEDIPSKEHVETVMEGIADTITGNEGYDLTHAQHYLQGVLFANNLLPSAQYHGTEGVWSTIKAGLQKAWQYVSDMVKKVFNFLFGSKKKEEVVELEISFKNLEKTAQIKPTSDKAEAKEQVKELVSNTKKMVSVTTAAGGGNENKELSKRLENLAELQSDLTKMDDPAKVKELTEKAIKEYKEAASRSIEVCAKKDIDKAEYTIRTLERLLKDMQGIHSEHMVNGEIHFDMSGLTAATEKYLNALRKWPEGLKEFKTLNQAPAYISKARSIMTAIKHSRQDFDESDKYFLRKLSDYKSLINKPDLEESKRKELKEALRVAGVGIHAVGEVGKTISKFITTTIEFVDCYALKYNNV